MESSEAFSTASEELAGSAKVQYTLFGTDTTYEVKILKCSCEAYLAELS